MNVLFTHREEWNFEIRYSTVESRNTVDTNQHDGIHISARKFRKLNGVAGCVSCFQNNRQKPLGGGRSHYDLGREGQSPSWQRRRVGRWFHSSRNMHPGLFTSSCLGRTERRARTGSKPQPPNATTPSLRLGPTSLNSTASAPPPGGHMFKHLSLW